MAFKQCIRAASRSEALSSTRPSLQSGSTRWTHASAMVSAASGSGNKSVRKEMEARARQAAESANTPAAPQSARDSSAESPLAGLTIPGLDSSLATPSTGHFAMPGYLSSMSSNRTNGGSSHTLHVQSSRNNVILTYTSAAKNNSKVIPTITGGSDRDFKKSNRSSYEAAHQAAIKMFKAIDEHRNGARHTITVAFKGMFGQGREAVTNAITGPEGAGIKNMITRVEDRTPIKIGGTRPPKQRRL